MGVAKQGQADMQKMQPADAPSAVQDALQVVLGGIAPLEARLGAVQALGDMAAPPYFVEAAEEALHRVLREALGEFSERIANAAEEALWSAWHRSGREEVDELLRQGMVMLEKGQTHEAVQRFTQVIELAPEWQEGWIKRATALFLLKQHDKSLTDSLKALELKPQHFGCLSHLGLLYQEKGNNEEALRYFKEAVKIHPGFEGARRFADRLEIQGVVNERLRPQIVRVARSLDESSKSQEEISMHADEQAPIPAALPSEGLVCDWDLYRVATGKDDTSWKYFIRVRLRNDSTAPSPVKSLARFYALRFVGGRIFPLTRVTEGSAAFMLEPSQENRFCWHVLFRHALQDAAGGLLLERAGQVYEESEERFLHADLVRKEPTEVSEDEVERLKLGYDYTGQLNFQDLKL
eukprot:TRINITY_DN77200_c0_g1_i1.p1 TRINITY_DN77200_c0_g1~~TRINITY_DN77200_c0_g1_i1.p1  ORF type:complete len:471 (-),score=112.79 TRINITY_DN77200_c0_g1_i1:23-1243(-)